MNYVSHLLLPWSKNQEQKEKQTPSSLHRLYFLLTCKNSKWGRPDQGCFISEKEQRARKRRRENWIYMVLCWLISSGTSRVHCHVHVGVSLFPLSPPVMSFPAHPALSCSAPSLIAVVASHQPSRYSLQQLLSSPLQPLAPKQLCSIPMIKLVGNVRFHVLLSPLLTPCYFFSNRQSQEQHSLSSICTPQEPQHGNNFTNFSPKLFSCLASSHTPTLLPCIRPFHSPTKIQPCFTILNS